jgi:hypothetical protein
VSDHTETHSDFTWPTADEAQAENARATGQGTPARDPARATLHHGPWPARQTPFNSSATEQEPPETRPDAGPHPPLPTSGRHTFLPHTRHQSCTRCGRPKHDPVHRDHPELRRASLISHLEMAIKAVREQDEHMAAIHVGTAYKLIGGDE